MLSKKQKKTWEEMRSWGLVCMKDDLGYFSVTRGTTLISHAYTKEEAIRAAIKNTVRIVSYERRI